MKDDTRCTGTILGEWKAYQCSRKGKFQRDGKWYCWQHDPVRVEDARKKSQQKWDEKWKIEMLRWERKMAMEKACEGIPTETLEKISVAQLLGLEKAE